jgi:hypothetical protein
MGRTESWPENDYERAYGWKSNTIHESEMALFSECMQWCARKVLDTADIVRDAMLRQQSRHSRERAGTAQCVRS